MSTYYLSTGDDRFIFHADHVDTDRSGFRPVVVIDPEDREQVERLGRALYDNGFTATGLLADALREFADPTPPKPEEPTGLGAVVEDSQGYFVVQAVHENRRRWYNPLLGGWLDWNDVDAVRILSDGVDMREVTR